MRWAVSLTLVFTAGCSQISPSGAIREGTPSPAQVSLSPTPKGDAGSDPPKTADQVDPSHGTLETSEVLPPASPPEPELQRLTQGGCCPYPAWLSDSTGIFFIQMPEGSSTAQLTQLSIPSQEESVFHEKVGIVSPNGNYLAFPSGGGTRIQDVNSGDQWWVRNGGRGLQFSPDEGKILWEVSSKGLDNLERKQRTLWWSEVAGENSKELVTILGGRFHGWLNPGWILATGRLDTDGPTGLWKVEVETGDSILLVEAQKFYGVAASPDGEWVAFTRVLDVDPSLNGLWVVGAEGSPLHHIKVFGSYRWSGEDTLFIIPLRVEGLPLELWEVEAPTGEVLQRASIPSEEFEIAGNDWQISPDGKWIVFRSARDQDLWLLAVPEGF